MLDKLKENMRKTNITNIEPINLDWKDVDVKERNWNDTYDLVFASMTPAVFNYDTLNKMLIASKKHCFLSSFVKRRDLLGDEIREYIVEKHHVSGKKADKIYYVFNILWQLGYSPEVQYFKRRWEDEMTLEEAYNIYSENMASLVTLTDDDKERIKEILKQKAYKGLLTEKTEVTQGILTWEV